MEALYARDVYGKTLVELGRKDHDIVVLDADLSGSTRTIVFGKEFPERFVNFGVAEQNMMAAAAGLASCGKIVFASTFAMFATARVLDQVRNSICYNNFNVKIVATHAGLTVGEDGASHQALEDVNFLRAIPNMKIIVPCDAKEARSAVIAAYQTKGPFYIRLGRSKTNVLEDKKDFVLGKGYTFGGQSRGDVAIIACGIMVEQALLAAGKLKNKGISATVANIHTIKPIDADFIVELARNHEALLICEEHQAIGGLYSAVCEVLASRFPRRAVSVAVNDSFGQSGSPKELLEFYGLTADSIAAKTEELLREQD